MGKRNLLWVGWMLIALGACSNRRNNAADSSMASGTSQPVAQPVVAAGPGRLASRDFAYQGAFRLPEAFDWGARGVTFLPASAARPDQLLVIGHDQRQAEFGVVNIPRPMVSRVASQLPMASMVGPMRNFDGPIVESVGSETVASGIAWVPRTGKQATDKLYGSIDNWYGVVDESHPTIWISELDGSRPRGPYHVGPSGSQFHGNKSGDFLFTVPADYAAKYLGGRTLVTGKTRGAFHGSQGPSMIAFRAWDSDQPSGNLDAVMLLSYRIRYPECAGPNVGDKAACDYPAFTMCDKWEGGSFVSSPSGSAVMLFGVKGLGPNRYGEPSSASCEQSKGYHCDPFERQMLLYDTAELGAVARGQRAPHTVLPYEVWKPRELLLPGQTCGQAGGIAYDPAGRRLFVIEKGVGESNSAVVHVWMVVR